MCSVLDTAGALSIYAHQVLNCLSALAVTWGQLQE